MGVSSTKEAPDDLEKNSLLMTFIRYWGETERYSLLYHPKYDFVYGRIWYVGRYIYTYACMYMHHKRALIS